MSSSIGNIFRVTGHSCGKFTLPAQMVIWESSTFIDMLTMKITLSKVSQLSYTPLVKTISRNEMSSYHVNRKRISTSLTQLNHYNLWHAIQTLSFLHEESPPLSITVICGVCAKLYIWIINVISHLLGDFMHLQLFVELTGPLVQCPWRIGFQTLTDIPCICKWHPSEFRIWHISRQKKDGGIWLTKLH